MNIVSGITLTTEQVIPLGTNSLPTYYGSSGSKI